MKKSWWKIITATAGSPLLFDHILVPAFWGTIEQASYMVRWYQSIITQEVIGLLRMPAHPSE